MLFWSIQQSYHVRPNIAFKYWFLSIDAFWEREKKNAPKTMIDHYFRSGNLTSDKKREKNRGKSPFVNSTCMTFHLSIAWSIKSLCVRVCVSVCSYFKNNIYLVLVSYSHSKQFLFTWWCVRGVHSMYELLCVYLCGRCGCGCDCGVCWKVRIQTEQEKTCHLDVHTALPTRVTWLSWWTRTKHAQWHMFTLFRARSHSSASHPGASQSSHCYCNKIQVTVLIIDINIT